MSPWKDALCLLAVLVAYGLAGHLDYQDAVAMEEGMREDIPPPCFAPLDATTDSAAPHPTEAIAFRLEATSAISHPACVPDNE